jgi:dihydroneopterin aldolase
MYGQPWCRDGIRIQDLTLQHSPHSGLDAWGREKEQPILLSVSLSFRQAFDSAAGQDALDDSTMHYGILAKNLRALNPSPSSADHAWDTLDDLADRIHQAILDTPPGGDLLQSCQIEIKLPKASLMGDFVTYVYFVQENQHVGRVLHLERICIPVLIGVNENERTAKQKLFVSVWIDMIKAADCHSYIDLEAILVQVINSFSTTRPTCSLQNTKQPTGNRTDRIRNARIPRNLHPQSPSNELHSPPRTRHKHPSTTRETSGSTQRFRPYYRNCQDFGGIGSHDLTRKRGCIIS